MVSKFSSGNWISTTSGTNTSTSSQATGMTSFSDYEVGEKSCSFYTIPSPSSNSPLCVCAGNTLNLSSSGGASYSWTGPNGFTSALQESKHPCKCYNCYDRKLYCYGYNASGCTASASVTVTVNNPSTSSSSVTACDTYTWNGKYIHYQWNIYL